MKKEKNGKKFVFFQFIIKERKKQQKKTAKKNLKSNLKKQGVNDTKSSTSS